MKNKFSIPLIIYITILILFVIFRERIATYVSKDVLFILAASCTIIVGVFVLVGKYQANSKKDT